MFLLELSDLSLSKILTILYILQATFNGNTRMKAAVVSVSKIISFFFFCSEPVQPNELSFPFSDHVT